MKELVSCKSCGYVMDNRNSATGARLRGTGKNVCPYTDRSRKRRFILSLDCTRYVHFPQAFTASLLILSLATLVLHGGLREKAQPRYSLLPRFFH